jgi:hypothetical protein
MVARQAYRYTSTFTKWMLVGLFLCPVNLWASCICCDSGAVNVSAALSDHAAQSCCANHRHAAQADLERLKSTSQGCCKNSLGSTSEWNHTREFCPHCGQNVAAVAGSLLPAQPLSLAIFALPTVEFWTPLVTRDVFIANNVQCTFAPPSWQALSGVWRN